MTTPTNREQQLERLIDRALRDQPTLRAPASLENKVLAEIARRAQAQAPWWRSSFAHWPLAVRIVFVAACVGFVKLGLDATVFVTGPIDQSAHQSALFAEVAWIPAFFATIGSALRSLPSHWIYGGVGLLGAMYLMLFGVSAAAYRTLYAPR